MTTQTSETKTTTLSESIGSLYNEQYYSLNEISKVVGVSSQRVQQIMDHAGIDRRNAKEAWEVKKNKIKNAKKVNVVALCYAGLRDKDIAKAAGVPLTIVTEILSESFPNRKYWLKTKHTKKYSDKDILNAIKQAANHIDGNITSAKYAKLAKSRKSWPSLATIVIRFESWRNACEQAGLETNKQSQVPQLYTDQDLKNALHDCKRDLGKIPLYVEYEKWARDNKRPCAALVRKRLRTNWRTIIKENLIEKV